MKIFLCLMCLFSVFMASGQSARKMNKQLLAELEREKKRQDSLYGIFTVERTQLGLLIGRTNSEMYRLNEVVQKVTGLLSETGKLNNKLVKLGAATAPVASDSISKSFDGVKREIRYVGEVLKTESEYSKVPDELYLDGLNIKEQNKVLQQKINEYKRYSGSNEFRLKEVTSLQQQLRKGRTKLDSLQVISLEMIHELIAKRDSLQQQLSELRENYRLKGPKGFPEAYYDVFPDIHPLPGNLVVNDPFMNRSEIYNIEQSGSHGSDIPPVSVSRKQQAEIDELSDEPATFPGGVEALLKYLKEQVNYPPTASEMGIQGKVYLKFVVSDKGKISNVRVLKGIPNCPECDREAVRVVRNMPDWIPGKNNDKPVNSYYTLPVKFELE